MQDPGSASYISTFEPAATFATDLMGEGGGADLTPILADPAGFERDLITHLDLGHTNAIATAVAGLDLSARAPDLAQPAATEAGYFTAITTACNTPTSPPPATTSAPDQWNQPATPSSNREPKEPECTGPSLAPTQS